MQELTETKKQKEQKELADLIIKSSKAKLSVLKRIDRIIKNYDKDDAYKILIDTHDVVEEEGSAREMQKEIKKSEMELKIFMMQFH